MHRFDGIESKKKLELSGRYKLDSIIHLTSNRYLKSIDYNKICKIKTYNRKLSIKSGDQRETQNYGELNPKPLDSSYYSTMSWAQLAREEKKNDKSSKDN
jgi:hypothetical protein